MAVKNKTALVIDPSVVWEGDTSLYVQAWYKAKKYQELNQPKFKELLKVDEIKIFGMIIGARGSWAPESRRILKAAVLRRGLADVIMLRMFEESRRIFECFMRVQAPAAV